jgi:mRNA interferase MazF
MRFDATDSVTLALCTSDPSELPLFRVAITPDATNGLRKPTSVMADKITTILRAKLGNKLGTLSDDDMRSLDTAIIMFLGLAE